MNTWNPYVAECPSRRVLDRIADKWSLLILAKLTGGPVRFNELRRTIQGLSQKVLSQGLKNLERDGLVTRTAIATVPVTVEYAITPTGMRLAERAQDLINWATDNMPAIIQAQTTYDNRALGR